MAAPDPVRLKVSALLASLLTLGVSAAAGAEELRPGAAHIMRLGEAATAVSYYTVDPDGCFRVVSTIGNDVEGASPVRATAMLMPGQSFVVSTPGPVGQPAVELVLMRVGNTLTVGEPPVLAAVAR